jgi:hypothetical protein
VKARRPILSILSIIAVVAATVLATPSSAYAGTDRWVLTTDSAPTGGVAIFDADSANDEIFYVCDLDADGHIAFGQFSWAGTQSFSFLDWAEEDGQCDSTTLWNVPEGQTVTVTACLVNKLSGGYDYCRTMLGTA